MSNSDLNTAQRQLVALVTGATGFVGSHLVRRLVKDGWQVHILRRLESRLPDSPEFAHTTNHTHDGSTQSMVECVAQARPDVVFHLASLFLAQHESKDIEPLVLSNVLFGSQLLEAMRINGVNNIVNTGTSWQHYNNEDYNPVCLYAATKQAFEAMVGYYVDACNFKVITLKLSDTYGPEDLRPKLFSFLEKVVKSEEILAMSPGEQLIDLVYIDDVIEAYLIAAERLLANEVSGQESYAVSSGNPMPLKELVAIYEKVMNKKLPIQWGGRPYRAREVMVPWSRGKSMPGFEAKVSLSEGIARMKRNK